METIHRIIHDPKLPINCFTFGYLARFIGIIERKVDRGIVICGTGIGISIAANRYKNIRATLCNTKEHAEMARKHNDSNVLALGGRTTSLNDLKNIIDVWLNTDFEGGRHQNRIDLIEKI